MAESAADNPGDALDPGRPSYAAGPEDDTARRSNWRRDQRQGDTGWTAEPNQVSFAESGRYGWGGFAQDAAAPDFEDLDPDYLAWRHQQLTLYDRDYAAWRDAQMQRHDQDYRIWRRDRGADAGFSEWFAERAHATPPDPDRND